AKVFGDPANGVSNATIFRRAKIINMDPLRVIRFPVYRHHMQHRFDAILDVKVRLALRAIAQHFQPVRMFQKLPIKIENVPMSIAFAKNRNETKNVAFESKPLAIGLDQTLASEFRCSVEGGLYRER